MKLVWHATHLLEADWIRDLLGDLVEEEITDLDLRCFDDDTIHVVSGNWSPLLTYEGYFSECRSRCRHIVLFHISDEWLSGGYHVYKYFDAVIRTYRTYLADCPGILTVPLGYPNRTRTGVAVRPANARQYAWSFAGEVKASRSSMISALEGLQPAFLRDSRVSGGKFSKAEFDDLLHDTVFSPCPMGNVVMETWRLYESLELGCIPLIERRYVIDYFEGLFGPNPIPSFRSWRQARSYAETAYGDKVRLQTVQAEINAWWLAHKAKVRAEVRKLISTSHASDLRRFGTMARSRLSAIYEPLRLAELLRHQTRASLSARLTRPGGPLKRNKGHSHASACLSEPESPRSLKGDV
jgi:hypothetical protein